MIVLDANILIRAVLGQRVSQLLAQYSRQGIRFYAPETAYAEAEEYLPSLYRAASFASPSSVTRAVMRTADSRLWSFGMVN